MTDFDDIQRMLEIMDKHGHEEFELERDGWRARLRKGSLAKFVPAATTSGAVARTSPSAGLGKSGAVAAGAHICKGAYRRDLPLSTPAGRRTVRRGRLDCPQRAGPVHH